MTLRSLPFLLIGLLSSGLFAQTLTQDPAAAPIVVSDIDLFWSVYDAAYGRPKARTLKEKYLRRGSPGVKNFIPHRIENGKKLAKTVAKNQAYYTSVRPYTVRIRELEPIIRKHYRRFKDLYPSAVYPAAYFVIGRLNSGGTTGPESLVMGAEMFGDPAATPPAKIDFAGIPELVIHELVHYQQKYDYADARLPAFIITEGSADFIAAVVLGKDLTEHHLDAYAMPKRREIWELFREQRNRDNSNGWLYGGNANKLFPDAPNDLGYWLGFHICSAYYAQATDKQQAISDILNITDFDDFIRTSGYDGQ